jgi:hypothetical protein
MRTLHGHVAHPTRIGLPNHREVEKKSNDFVSLYFIKSQEQFNGSVRVSYSPDVQIDFTYERPLVQAVESVTDWNRIKPEIRTERRGQVQNLIDRGPIWTGLVIQNDGHFIP